MVSEKKGNITVLSGGIESLTTEVADNFGEVFTSKKQIVFLEYQVAKLAVMCDAINSKSEEWVANNMELSENNYELINDIDSIKTNIKTLSAEISEVNYSEDDLWKTVDNISVS